MACQILAEYFSSFLLPWNSYILLFSLDFFFWDWISLFSLGYPQTLNSVWVIQRLRIQACTITSKFKHTVLTSWLHLPFHQFLPHILKVKWELKVHHILVIAASSVSPRMLSSFHKQEYICLLFFLPLGLAKTTNLLTLSVMASFPVSPHHNAYI